MHVSDCEERLTTHEIAHQINVPYNHVTKAVLELRKLGALDVTRGRSGGAKISEKGQHYSVGELLRQLDPREDVVDCHTEKATCPMIGRCRLRSALRQAREAFYAELDDLRVKDLMSEKGGPTILPLPKIRSEI